MWRAFRDLCSRAWHNLLAALSTSTLSIVLFSFVLPVAGFFVALIPDVLQREKTGASMAAILKASVISWQTMTGVIVTMVTWPCLIGWFVVRTVLTDQLALVGALAENKRLSAELEKAGQTSQQQSTEETKKQIALLTDFIDSGQALISRCRNEKSLVPEDEALRWANEAELAIENIFDGTYLSRFRSGIGTPMGAAYWPNLENRHVDGFSYVRVYRLQEFVDELRANLQGLT